MYYLIHPSSFFFLTAKFF